ncbi:MAG TPA: class I SAM-dependent methyltransferase, partial [Nitrospirota bacterium]|nr:class I SAM-dependent methyltransferase [Nitrospirota bacterium]
LLQPHVGSITGVDSSKGMLGVLEDKVKKRKLTNVSTQFIDFEKGERAVGQYDLIVSNMTLHHVSDIRIIFSQWYDLLKPRGRICFSDLDSEDGSFHADNIGVFHYGFRRSDLKELVQAIGFYDIYDTMAATIMKSVEGKQKAFSVFLISATK